MPTLDAANHRAKHADLPPGATPPMWLALQRDLDAQGVTVPVVDVLDETGQPLPGAVEVLRLAARHQLVVATGHLSAYESRVIAEAASKAASGTLSPPTPSSRSRTWAWTTSWPWPGKGPSWNAASPHRSPASTNGGDGRQHPGHRRRAHHHHLGPRPASRSPSGGWAAADGGRAAGGRIHRRGDPTMIVSNSGLRGPITPAQASPAPASPAPASPVRPGWRQCVTTTDGFGRLLVVSAHAADFVWRAARYIAVVTAAFGQAHVVCLSYGEHGESPGAWKAGHDRGPGEGDPPRRGGGGRPGARGHHALPGPGRLSPAGHPGPGAASWPT